MKKIAFMTVGRLHEPFSHARSQGFIDRVGAVYQAADNSAGFLDRSDRDMETLVHSWGPVKHPRCYGGEADSERLPSTLSIWKDLESVAVYAYSGVHAEALEHRKEWFTEADAPTYVAFWVDPATERVGWQEAADRLDFLHENGPTAYAFNFKKPFDAEGHPVRLDPIKFKRLADGAK